MIALDTFPKGLVSDNEFIAEPETEEFVSVLTNKKNKFRKMYDYFYKNLKKEEFAKPKQIRDYLLGVRKTNNVNLLEELTMDVMGGYYDFSQLNINLQKTPEFQIDDTAYMIYKSCSNHGYLVDQTSIANRILFLKFNQDNRILYVLRKTLDGDVNDYIFEVRSGSKKGDFYEMVYNTKGLCYYDVLYKNSELAYIAQTSENLKIIRNAQIKREIGELENCPFPIEIFQPVDMNQIKTGLIAKIIEERIKEMDGRDFI